MSGSEEGVNALFDSSDEDEASQQPRSQDAAPAADAAPDRLRQPEGDDDEGQQAAPSDEDAAAEPLTANRRFAQDEEEDEDGENSERRQQQGPPEVEPGPPLELEGPLVKGPDHKSIRLVRASNILGVQPKPFSPETHVYEQEEYHDQDTGKIQVRLNNAIRWRHVQQPDGSTTRESNARFVRWSDGTLQLFVGNEVLDVAEIDVSGDHHYMYVRHRGFIQAQAQLATRLAFRPSSTKSAGHKRLAAMMDKRHGFKGARIQSTTTMVDPAREKAQRAKLEEARIRDREGLQKRQEKEMRKYSRAPARAAGGGLSAAYLEAADEEPEEDDDEEGLTASERARQALARPRRDARDEVLKPFPHEEAERRLASAKRGAPPGSSQPTKRQRAAYDEEEDDEEMGDFIVDEEDDEEEAVGARKPAGGRRRIALSDEDED